jgi:hypothetical protein
MILGKKDKKTNKQKLSSDELPSAKTFTPIVESLDKKPLPGISFNKVHLLLSFIHFTLALICFPLLFLGAS